MSSLDEKEMEKVKDLCIGDCNGNNHRNWCSDLPVDVLLLIMSKVGAIHILTDAQWVCKDWRKVCSEVPSLWRNIDMTPIDDPLEIFWTDYEWMACEAIDRAQGGIQQFGIRYFGDDALLQYLADSTSLLRCLRIIQTPGDITRKGLAESLVRFPLLEELDITFNKYEEIFELVGEACPHLKCFRYNQAGGRKRDPDDNLANDEEALGIANYMPNLCHLHIIGNFLTNAGLMAILDKCVHLESLDLRCCFDVNMDASLRAKCAHIKDLRLPDDPTDDFEFGDGPEMMGW